MSNRDLSESPKPSAEAEPSAAAEPAADAASAEISELQAQLKDQQDQVLRTRADMENLRRRTERELENAHKYALERFAQELLPVKDSLELGLAAVESGEAGVEKIREGTELTLKLFETVLEKFGISVVNPVDQTFNPEQHQAVAMLESPGKPANAIISVMQKGYLLNDRLIRPAMVVVARAPAGDQGGQSGSNLDEQA